MRKEINRHFNLSGNYVKTHETAVLKTILLDGGILCNSDSLSYSQFSRILKPVIVAQKTKYECVFKSNFVDLVSNSTTLRPNHTFGRCVRALFE